MYMSAHKYNRVAGNSVKERNKDLLQKKISRSFVTSQSSMISTLKSAVLSRHQYKKPAEPASRP